MTKKTKDAIVLLGVALGENDQPTDEMRARVLAAAQLYRESGIPCIIASGGVTDGHAVSEAAVMAKLLEKSGVPQSAIKREAQSQDTMENMRFSKALLGEHADVVVVTSDYHLRRAVMTARRVGLRASGHAALLPHDAAWKTCSRKELTYTVDLLMGWQDEGKQRPKWTYTLFDFVFGKR